MQNLLQVILVYWCTIVSHRPFWLWPVTLVLVVLRLMKFNEEWPMMEKWFDQFSILKQVDASAGADDVADAVDNIIQQFFVTDVPQVHKLSVRFNGHFPDGPWSAGTRMASFWILLQLRMMEVVLTTGAVRRAKLQLNRHRQQINTQFFTGRMLFLIPQPTVQQCQSTEGKNITYHRMDHPKLTWGLPTLSLTTKGSWLSWGRVAKTLFSPLTPVPLACTQTHTYRYTYTITVLLLILCFSDYSWYFMHILRDSKARISSVGQLVIFLKCLE